MSRVNISNVRILRQALSKLHNELETAKNDHELAASRLKEANEKSLIELAEQYKGRSHVGFTTWLETRGINLFPRQIDCRVPKVRTKSGRGQKDQMDLG